MVAKSISKESGITPALTPDSRINKLISLALDVIEGQLIEGKASPLVTSQLLKLGTSRNQLETERLKAETKLLEAKQKALESAEVQDELYMKAIEAMQRYSRSSDIYD